MCMQEAMNCIASLKSLNAARGDTGPDEEASLSTQMPAAKAAKIDHHRKVGTGKRAQPRARRQNIARTIGCCHTHSQSSRSPSTLTPQRVHAAAELLALMQSIRSALVRCWLAARVAGHDGARSKAEHGLGGHGRPRRARGQKCSRSQLTKDYVLLARGRGDEGNQTGRENCPPKNIGGPLAS